MNNLKGIEKIYIRILKIVFILTILLLSTSLSYKVNAMEMNYGILCDSSNLYCSQRGAPMPSYSVEFQSVGFSYTTPREAYILYYGTGYHGYKSGSPQWQLLWWETTRAGKGETHTPTGYVGGYNENDEIIYLANSKVFNDDNRATGGSTLLADFVNADKNKNSYVEVAGKILNFAVNGTDGTDNNEENNQNDGLILDVNDTKIDKNAATSAEGMNISAFEKYFAEMTGQKQPVCDDSGFPINRKFQWLTGGDYDNPSVSKKDNEFVVGPFGLDYVHMSSGNMVFSEMTNMELIVGKDDGSEKTLVLNANDGFKINKQDGVSAFPEPNEPFYLVFASIDDITKIKDIKVYFRYMNAKGAYELWDGSTTIPNPNGTTETSEASVVKDLQTLSEKKTAEIWYEPVELNRNMNIARGSIAVKKILVDSEGNEVDYSALTDEEKIYNFSLTVEGATISNGGNPAGRTTEEITGVKAGGDYVTSQVYYWFKNENSKPKFTLKETTGDKGTLVSINGNGTYNKDEKVFSGELIDGTSVELDVTNKIETKKGKIDIKKIEKEVIDPRTGETYHIDKDDEFDVNVKIIAPEDGTFRVKEQDNSYTYYGKGNVFTKKLSIKVGETQSIEGIEWIGNKAPTYEVEEDLTGRNDAKYDVKLVSITPKTGELVEISDTNTPITVTIENELVLHKAKIHIIKTVVIDKDGTEVDDLAKKALMEKIKDEKFAFDICVKGYEDEHTGDITSKYDGTKYIWEYTSNEYYWKGDAPQYEIKETKAPEGTEFKGTTEGQLAENKENDYIVDNEVQNHIGLKNSKLSLQKIIDHEDLVNKEFKFELKLTGIFMYDGTTYTATEENPVYLKNDNGNIVARTDKDYIVLKVNENQFEDNYGASDTIESKEIYWCESAGIPKYEVIEDTTGLDDVLKSTEIINGKGNLKIYDNDNDNTIIKVVAKNNGKITKEGRLHFIKTLENADIYDLEELKSLIFYVDIEYDMNPQDGDEFKADETERLDLKPQATDDNKIVWEEYTGTKTWKEDENAPKYRITEVNIPDGIKLKSMEAKDDETDIFDDNTHKLTGTLKEFNTDEIDLNLTEIEVINRAIERYGYLKIKKVVNTNSLKSEKFEFNIKLIGSFEYAGTTYTNTTCTIKNFEVNGGNEKSIGPIKWAGNTAPRYVVEEVVNEKTKLVSIVNDSGPLISANTTDATDATAADDDKNTVTVVATNEAKTTGGYLEITKQIEGGKDTDKTFTFEIKIGDYEPYRITLKANETYKTDRYEWNVTDNAPAYKVTELTTEGSELAKIIEIGDGDRNNKGGTVTKQGGTAGWIGGELKPNGEIVKVVATNELNDHYGAFKIHKQVIADTKRVPNATTLEFNIKYTVIGNFEYSDDGGKTYKEPENKKLEKTISVNAGGEYNSPQFKWYGDIAPTVSVTEDLTGENYKGWKNTGISNNNVALQNNKNISIVVSNEFTIISKLDLTIKLAGDVWKDEKQIIENDLKRREADGIINTNKEGIKIEEGIKGVEVYIYEYSPGKLPKLAKLYSDSMDTELKQPIITSATGNWTAPRVNMSGESDRFEVRFVYDGQTYEPTKLLGSDSSDEIGKFMKSSQNERNTYANTSMAKDINREAVNNRIQSIYGNLPITGDGNTVGEISGPGGNTAAVYYESTDTDGVRKSKLQTTNKDGVAYDLYKTTASTVISDNAALVFPFDNAKHLDSVEMLITDYGGVTMYRYNATYPYTEHINLGLVERENTDISVSKDLVKANVVVKNRLAEYPFNGLSKPDIGDIYKINLSYDLGLYKTDYYYRSEMYQAGMSANDYNALNASYSGGINATELEVYLQYKITISNTGSDLYKVKINSIDDYYDSTFKLVDSTVEKDIEGKSNKEPVAYGPTYGPSGKTIKNITPIETNIKGSDGVEYNKMNIKLDDCELASGNSAEITLWYQIEKGDYNNVQKAIALGGKANIAEVSNYSTYYNNNNNIYAGKIDCDSAPANINIKEHNIKSYYEDDTYSAPLLDLNLTTENRTVSGIVWEDNVDTKNKNKLVVGNGIKDDGEALVGGLTTELVEKLNIRNDNDTIEEYDFIWPTDTRLDSLGGKSIEDLVGFDSTIETGREGEDTGKYTFNETPTGNYVVRFIYGNDKTNLQSTLGITPAATASSRTDTNNTADANNAAVYNGQDYKSTIYRKDQDDLIEEWFNFDKNDAKISISDAKDNETRRLELIKKSETITNSNAEILDSATDNKVLHTDLYNDYYMFADTAKLKLGKDRGSVGNIDFGLIGRPKTAILLDKEISEIILRTNDGKVIFDAKYDISYDLADESKVFDKKLAEVKRGNETQYLVAKIELIEESIGAEVLQALDKIEDKIKAEGKQNFRYINVDDEILQGTTIELGYKMNVLNVGDIDYTSETLANITSQNDTDKVKTLNNAIEESKTNKNVGKYLGSFYYTGEIGNDEIVKTKVRQLVDFVDNDGVFETQNNVDTDHSWRTTSSIELQGYGYDDNRMLSYQTTAINELYDGHGKANGDPGQAYITDNNKNIVLSIDDTENKDNGLNNNGLEADLVPIGADGNSQSDIEITVTKVVSAQDDANNLAFDNISEIIKYENSVGRRDVTAVPGNSNPKAGEFKEGIKERDSSATEIVTFTPPQGIDEETVMTSQILIVVIIALGITVVGIVLIKKLTLKDAS